MSYFSYLPYMMYRATLDKKNETQIKENDKKVNYFVQSHTSNNWQSQYINSSILTLNLTPLSTSS